MHILVIEDHDPMAETIIAILEADRHTAVRAVNGRYGMAQFETGAFDLVITDILMPDQEGLETIRAMVKRKPDVRIIAVSGSGRDGGFDYLNMARSFGAMATLQKPFQPADLLTLVHSVGRVAA